MRGKRSPAGVAKVAEAAHYNPRAILSVIAIRQLKGELRCLGTAGPVEKRRRKEVQVCSAWESI